MLINYTLLIPNKYYILLFLLALICKNLFKKKKQKKNLSSY